MGRALRLMTLLAWLLVPATATATTYVRELDARQLGQRAAAIVRGEVSGVHSFWNEARTKIFTEIVVQAHETYKGEAGGAVTILQLGGVVDNVRVTVHGALAWQPGEEVLLFLEPSSRDRYQVAGFSQGKLAIERDPASGEAFVSGPAPGGADKAHGGRPARIPLSVFLREALGERPEIQN